MPTDPLRAALFLIGFWLALALLQPIGSGALADARPASSLGSAAPRAARVP